ncbi:MAG TPA: AAA family ATPase, partial [Chitinophagales bacterium]|nr:AAA family ATPase [Chitinophagales bacterium]
MLESILIKNYAIIESIELDFHNGFNIITGETGAGKSILLGALGLILGKRADTQVLRNKEEKCIIEAKFDIQQLQIESFFEENELEFERQCIIRREIQPNGKSRAFINDTPVNLSQLQELSNALVDIHAQGETQKLLDEYFFCSILDKLAGQEADTENYYHQFLEYKQLNKKLHQIQSEREQLQLEYDFNLFIYKEFEQIDLAEDVYNNLEQEIDIQQNAELIIQNLRSIEKLLDENEYSVIP